MAHGATVEWDRGGAPFTDNRYSRAHRWTFDGGTVIAASSSPAVVPLPMSDAGAVDPEEAFVASIAACHMLWFLDLARQAGRVVDSYRDAARGTMARRGDGMLWLAHVDLHPAVTWAGPAPGATALRDLHDTAHRHCFIANSVRTEIRLHARNG
ncbi:OsmC family protein [Jannaschia rubra]|uniref:OsmC-like protein n=1 Tax=Jannaschia rubra TaxID=282197 RepID=A0A0M6XS72_9RHOB|nr:OsmC family protein [Jannaschia rubra]CTQ33512.1 OsmC-like protein [Jannaschia rubra]SFG03003.1 Organic hydroperoxide reductase OsmC/OhrA [Jannaschia rubra]